VIYGLISSEKDDTFSDEKERKMLMQTNDTQTKKESSASSVVRGTAHAPKRCGDVL
jgi:hypothetical protein